MDAAPAEPWCSGPIPAAAAAPAPALEPPVVIVVFQGLREMPVNGLSPIAFQPNSGVVVFPTMMAPASLRRRTNGGTTAGKRAAEMNGPGVVIPSLGERRSCMATEVP